MPRKRKLNRFIAVFVLCCFFSSSYPLYALEIVTGDTAKLVKFSRKLQKEGKYEEALDIYVELLKEHPDSDIFNYNAGALAFNTGNYEGAIGYFTKALSSENISLERDALYNIGNSYYRMSENSEEGDIEKAMALSEKSMEYYKRSIEISGNDRTVRRNYETAFHRVRALDKKSRKPKKPSPKGGEGKKGSKSQQQQQERQKKRERQKEDNQTQKERQQQDKQKQNQRQKENQSKEKQQQQQNQQQASNPQSFNDMPEEDLPF